MPGTAFASLTSILFMSPTRRLSSTMRVDLDEVASDQAIAVTRDR